MVNFRSHLPTRSAAKIIDPIQLYESLDRAHDKGPLRPAQAEVLGSWHATHRGDRDVIVKLHTGQGKTLIGLLMLQSLLHEGKGPALYLCPNIHLAEQTEAQAKSFGISVVTTEPREDLPTEFVNGTSIYVATAQKLFNGLTKFGTGTASIPVGSIVLDDCHAITDSMRQQMCINLPAEHAAFRQIIDLFDQSLTHQGAGTLEDIRRGKPDAFLRVPYWDIMDRAESLLGILSRHASDTHIKYAWPLLRDQISFCDIYIAGDALEIVPNALPIDEFGSFDKANHRICMSATVTDDSFLVKTLGLDQQAVTKPITYSKERWSGEKMILLPELIDHDLGRHFIISEFAKPDPHRRHGVVVLCPSLAVAKDWHANGAIVAERNNIAEGVEALRAGRFEKTLVLVNRYDGVDLPDDICRILILDGLPLAAAPSDRQVESVNFSSSTAKARIFRRIEQGLGRSVRGEKDYSVVIMTGSRLVPELRLTSNQQFLSPQTQAQVRIGMDVTEFAEEEGRQDNTSPADAFRKVVRQLIQRDDGWKDYYKASMDAAAIIAVTAKSTAIFAEERVVDILIRHRQARDAATALQSLLDSHRATLTDSEQAAFYERLAQTLYLNDPATSRTVQIKAHQLNRHLLLPATDAPATIYRDRANQIQKIIGKATAQTDTRSLLSQVDGILRRLSFGENAGSFEAALKELGDLWGFESMRPEKEYRAGPDNVWVLPSGETIVFECKSEVDTQRAEIFKGELEQLLSADAWAHQCLGESDIYPLLIIPTRRGARDAAATADCRVLRSHGLRSLCERTRAFYQQMASLVKDGNLREDTVVTALGRLPLGRAEVYDKWADPIQLTQAPHR